MTELEIDGVTWTGPVADDVGILADLPRELRSLLGTTNGFILYGGALHVRGATIEPAWHSLRLAWHGDFALSRLYPAVHPDDVPFGEDCVGDQFILRRNRVFRVMAETGEVQELSESLWDFLSLASRESVEFLRAQPLVRYCEQGCQLTPGRLLHVWPPFCSKESARGYSIRDVPALELLHFHADVAAQILDRPDGNTFKVVIKNSNN